MAVLTNQDVQGILTKSIYHIERVLITTYSEEVFKLTLIKEYLKFVKAYSASGNSIPSGIGIHKVVKLAESIIDNNVQTDFDIQIFNLGSIADAIYINIKS